MLVKEIYEEYFLNSSLSPYTTNICGFIMKYGALQLYDNCIFPLYEKEDDILREKILAINSFLLEHEYLPIYRIVRQENYERLDRMLFSNNYDKVETSIVLGCSLNGKKEELFRYADFNENGIYVEDINFEEEGFFEDYSMLKEFSREEAYLFKNAVKLIPFEKQYLSLVESGKLIGQAFFTRQEDVVVIKDIVISKKYRGLGYSSKMLFSLLTHCLKKEANLVLAEVFLSNENATELFYNNQLFQKLYSVHYKQPTRIS